MLVENIGFSNCLSSLPNFVIARLMLLIRRGNLQSFWIASQKTLVMTELAVYWLYFLKTPAIN